MAEYKIIIETENEDKTPKRRAILAAAFDRKQRELEDVARIIEQYKINQKSLVEKAHELENKDIKEYEKEIEIHRQEIREMEFLLENASKAKDVLAIENDKQKLKDLDAAVKNIKHRQRYSQTPSEIYDEIEISLGTMDINSTLLSEDILTSSKEETATKKEEETTLEPDIVLEELPTLDFETEDENDDIFVVGEYEEDTEVENENQE